MMQNRIFHTLRTMNMLFIKLITQFWGKKAKSRYIRFSYRIKFLIFPEYGAFIPDIDDIGFESSQVYWKSTKMPSWLISEMQALGQSIDTDLFPSKERMSKYMFSSPPILNKPGEYYREFINKCSTSQYSHCFTVPWFKRGGADLVSLHYIQLASSVPNTKVLVIITEQGDSPWLDRLPPNVDLIDLSQAIGKVSHQEYLRILMRLLVELDVDVLHNINSRHMWEVLTKYGKIIKNKMNVFASIFCDDYDKNNLPVGFARSYLHSSCASIEKLFCDNAVYPKQLQETYGFSSELFQVVYTPTSIADLKNVRRESSTNRILWAGRLDRQKRPDILLMIAEAMPNVEFVVYGENVLTPHNHCMITQKKHKNVRFMGPFDGADKLQFNDYAAFLYTSQWDGIPTILLAAATMAIPIVASSVGGIHEIITHETGFPVECIESINDYVHALERVLNDKELAQEKAWNAKTLVDRRHNSEMFRNSVLSTPNYVKKYD